MAQEVMIQGAIFSSVPSIKVPNSQNVYHSFYDVSDTTATASDVAQGKYFYASDGTRTLGTNANQGVSVTETPDSHGGTIIEITGEQIIPMHPWLMRGDAEKVYTLAYDKYIVADEGVDFPAYTTSAKTLKASETVSPTVSYNSTHYNYLIAERTLSIPEYSVTTKAKGRVEYSFASAFYELVDYPANTISGILDNKKLTSRSYSTFSAGNNVGLVYWSSGTAIARYATASYGVAQTITAPTAGASTITIKTPALIARGHTTYFTSTYMNAVTDVRYQYIIEVYRVPKNNMDFNGWGLYNMSLHCIDCATSSDHTLS